MKNETQINRRDFVVNSTMALGGILAATMLPGSVGKLSGQTKVAGISPSQLPTRQLGALKVSAIGFGCMNLAGAYSARPDRNESLSLLRTAVEHGVTFFDTAQSYGAFYSEEVVGEALQPFRKDVVIATKFGYEVGQKSTRPSGLNSTPEFIKRSVEKSLIGWMQGI